ncbi:MAG TPA: hypothetical protein DDZ22_02245 [Massilia sp.]|nr:hypothetical protein [Massilia sp.]
MRDKNVGFAAFDLPPEIVYVRPIFLSHTSDYFFARQTTNGPGPSAQLRQSHSLGHRKLGFGRGISLQETCLNWLDTRREYQHKADVWMTRQMGKHHDRFMLFGVERTTEQGVIDTESAGPRHLVFSSGFDLADKLGEIIESVDVVIVRGQI